MHVKIEQHADILRCSSLPYQVHSIPITVINAQHLDRTFKSPHQVSGEPPDHIRYAHSLILHYLISKKEQTFPSYTLTYNT